MSTTATTRERSSSPPSSNEINSRAVFVTTHWSVVLSAQDKESPRSAEALEQLCRAYWYPLYAYARWRGHSAHDAEDLTQEFFARLLQKNYLEAVERERGRFRTFLLVAFKRFLSDEWERARAQKRGGGNAPAVFDTELAERLYQSEPAPRLPADRMYEQRWAVALLEKSLARLRAEFESAGKTAEFDRLKRFLAVGKPEVAQAGAGPDSGMSDGALRVAVHRLRKRFRRIFREEIAQTVAKAEDVEEELRHLLAVLSE
jgi:RNA polymerase sigma factor (sigma-70 family)